MPTHVSLRRSPRCTRDGHLGRGRHSGESEWIEANCDSVVISTSYIPRLSSQDLSHRRLPQTRYISRAAPVQVCKPVADGGTSLHRAPSLLTSGMADVKYGLWTCELQMKHESSPGVHHQVSCCSSTYTRTPASLTSPVISTSGSAATELVCTVTLQALIHALLLPFTIVSRYDLSFKAKAPHFDTWRTLYLTRTDT